VSAALSVLAERFWPAARSAAGTASAGKFTLPTAAELEAQFEALGNPEAVRRAEWVSIGEGTL
jgi:hypothetical protein